MVGDSKDLVRSERELDAIFAVIAAVQMCDVVGIKKKRGTDGAMQYLDVEKCSKLPRRCA